MLSGIMYGRSKDLVKMSEMLFETFEVGALRFEACPDYLQ